MGVLPVEDFSMLSFTATIEPLRSANRMSGETLYEWCVVSEHGNPVRASNGIEIIANVDFKSADKPHALVICSGGMMEPISQKTYAWLRELSRHGVHLGGCSGGTYYLARAGLLDDYRCTIHWEYFSGITEEFPEINLSPRLFEIDRDRFTSAGSDSTMEMMLHIIGHRHGHDLALSVSEQFTHHFIDDPEASQRMPLRQRLQVSHPKLICAIQEMENNLEEPLGRDELARRVNLSTRQVERLFMKYLGRTPARYYMELRLRRAQKLLEQTSMSIMDVSVACGFVSASHFSKCYREMFAHPPRQERAPKAPQMAARRISFPSASRNG